MTKIQNFFFNSQTSKQTWNFEGINVKMEQKTSENHLFEFLSLIATCFELEL
jgi:hypothetical protein